MTKGRAVAHWSLGLVISHWGLVIGHLLVIETWALGISSRSPRARLRATRLATTPAARMASTTASTYRLKCRPKVAFSQPCASIFTPTTISTTDNDSLRYLNVSIIPASAKYRLRRPRIAKTLLV